MCNTTYKVEIMSVECSDTKGIKDVQQKINVWITTGILVKYEMLTTSTHIVFNICKTKDK
jgi:hypothetical protein